MLRKFFCSAILTITIFFCTSCAEKTNLPIPFEGFGKISPEVAERAYLGPTFTLILRDPNMKIHEIIVRRFTIKLDGKRHPLKDTENRPFTWPEARTNITFQAEMPDRKMWGRVKILLLAGNELGNIDSDRRTRLVDHPNGFTVKVMAQAGQLAYYIAKSFDEPLF